MMACNDFLDDIVDLEKRCYDQGFTAGKFEGHCAGIKEGSAVGYKQGALLAKEVKSYQTFAEVLIEKLSCSPESRTIKTLEGLRDLCSQFVNENTEDLIEVFNVIKAKYKQACSLLNKQNDNSIPGSTDLSF